MFFLLSRYSLCLYSNCLPGWQISWLGSKGIFFGGGVLKEGRSLGHFGKRFVSLASWGLGIIDLKFFNLALLGKWIWRLGSDKGDLWKEILISKYGG